MIVASTLQAPLSLTPSVRIDARQSFTFRHHREDHLELRSCHQLSCQATSEVRYYRAGPLPTEIEADLTSKQHLQDAANVAARLGGAQLGDLRVLFAPDPHALRLSTRVAGVTQYGQVEVFEGKETFAHEFTHALLQNQDSHGPVMLPVWFHEGIAELMEGSVRPDAADGPWKDYNIALQQNAESEAGCQVGPLGTIPEINVAMAYGVSPYLLNTHHALRRAGTPNADFWAYWGGYIAAKLAASTPTSTAEILAHMDASVPGFSADYHLPGGAGPTCPGVPILAMEPLSVPTSPQIDPKAPHAEQAAQWAALDLSLTLKQVQDERVLNANGTPDTNDIRNWKVFSQVPYALACAPQIVEDKPSTYAALRDHSLFACDAVWTSPYAPGLPNTLSTPLYRNERVSVLTSDYEKLPLSIVPEAIFDGTLFAPPFPAVIRLHQIPGMNLNLLPEVFEKRVICGPSKEGHCTTDNDADGSPLASDCNDYLPDVFPGAGEELIQGQDNDCNCIGNANNGTPEFRLGLVASRPDCIANYRAARSS